MYYVAEQSDIPFLDQVRKGKGGGGKKRAQERENSISIQYRKEGFTYSPTPPPAMMPSSEDHTGLIEGMGVCVMQTKS
jgi:hypothetical protein